MKLCPAKAFDMNDIMAIERSAFIPSIQEKQKVFEERMEVFPEGFLILTDNSDEAILRFGKTPVAGYFCSELWPCVPDSDEIFSLGHSARKVHDKNGPVLYFSSFALHPSYQGKHLAESFLEQCLNSLCGAFPQIKKIILLVNEEWQGAKHIYEKLGFTELRRLSSFFPSLKNESSDGILMIKEIN